MTNKEAIEVMQAYKDKLSNSCSNQLDKDIEAFDKAIKALEEKPQGEWLFIDNDVGWYGDVCSNCNWTDARCHTWLYCPNCGAIMKT